MKIFDILGPNALSERALSLFEQERAEKKILNGWFLSREIADEASRGLELDIEEKAAFELEAIVNKLPLEISEYAIFAGTQRDAFAASYALINPSFQVETFKGYCDPLEVYDYASPTDEISPERIASMRERAADSDYVRELNAAYGRCAEYTGEVAFFVEQVTGHLIPDFCAALKQGVNALIEDIDRRMESGNLTEKQHVNYRCMKRCLCSAITLAHRYRRLALDAMETASPERRKELQLMVDTLSRVPEFGARNLYEAMQSYILLWQLMCLEQAPNPFAFSVGNADRIFYPYYQMGKLSREECAALFKHFLVFFNVGERSWAISQNVLISGRDLEGNDLSNELTYAIMDAYYEMNLPQPILSVKLHRNTPSVIYEELGRFLFTPGCLTPSFFNDDSFFSTLSENGIEPADLPDYSVAGCQEPLIMGKDTANTTNSWLNLGKVLELTLTGGKSLITGEKIGPQPDEDAASLLSNLKERFYQRAEFFIDRMTESANDVSHALSNLRIPFLSCFMGGIESGIDCRDTEEQGSKYNGSGCLIHGLSVVSDSLVAVKHLMTERPQDAEALITALKNNFEGHEELREYLRSCPKFGNHIAEADAEAAELARRISQMVRQRKNYLGNPFRPDWSSPSTHLLYGYWVGATPDSRGSREMLNYGIDPLYGEAANGLGFRTLSTMELPFEEFNGGVASHFGVDPQYFNADTMEEKGLQFKNRIITPLFFNPANAKRAPSYLYVNVTTPEILRKVLEDPKKYAPNGVYIMRIHGTFVNFLDLSPAIQQDIIKRLDLRSTVCC